MTGSSATFAVVANARYERCRLLFGHRAVLPPLNVGKRFAHPAGWQGFAADWSLDQRAFKNVPWGIWLISGHFGLCTWLELLHVS